MWKRELIRNKIYAVLMVLASLPVVILERDGTVLLLESVVPWMHGFQDGPNSGTSRSVDSLWREVGLPRMQEVCDS